MGNQSIDQTKKIQFVHFSWLERVYFKLFRPWMSDQTYARWSLRRAFGGGDPNAPQTFNEKIQWLKLYDRNPLYVSLVDKYAVREFVKVKIGGRYLNKLFGVYDSPDQIDYDKLPEQFVIKATHGSGMNRIVRSKSDLRISEITVELEGWLNTNYYKLGREWAYKDVPPRIICEQLLLDEHDNIPIDYKVFCFNGTPTYIQVDLDRFTNHTRVFYDINWQRQPFSILYPISQRVTPRPESLNEMLILAEQLACDIPFSRVDFYALPRLVFGEITLYPENGTAIVYPAEWDLKLGEQLDLQGSKARDPGRAATRNDSVNVNL